MEDKKEDGALNLKKVAGCFILPVFILFLCWIGVSLKNNTANTIGTIMILAVLAGIIALIYYVIVGAKIMFTDVVVVEAKLFWEDLHTTGDKKDKKKK